MLPRPLPHGYDGDRYLYRIPPPEQPTPRPWWLIGIDDIYWGPDGPQSRDRSTNTQGRDTAPEHEGLQHMTAPDNVVPLRRDEEVRSTSSTGAEKGTKLARYDLIPAGPLRQLAEHYGVGSAKYQDRNWEKGYEWSKSFAALNRHLWAFWSGEDIDEETGSPHIVAVMWHAAALAEYRSTHPEFDDRPTTVAAREAAGDPVVAAYEELQQTIRDATR